MCQHRVRPACIFFPFVTTASVTYILGGRWCLAGDIPAATAEDVDIAVKAARAAILRNKGKDWAKASGHLRAKYLRAISAKVMMSSRRAGL